MPLSRDSPPLPLNASGTLEEVDKFYHILLLDRLILVLLRFAKKSPTSSPGIDIDVARPNIDVLNILEFQNHNSGTMQRTEMADHLLESLEHMKDRTAA